MWRSILRRFSKSKSESASAASPTPELSASEIIDLIASAVPDVAKDALGELESRARVSGNPDQYADLARAYIVLRRFDDAVDILSRLVEFDASRDEDRFSLAMSYWQLEQVELCRLHLAHVAEHAVSEPLRSRANVELRQYVEALGLGELDKQLMLRQEASLREQLTNVSAPAVSFIRLGRLLLRRGRLTGEADMQACAATTLEDGHQRHPKDPTILELLIFCYLHHDAGERLDRALHELEQIDPESDLLNDLKRQRPEDSESVQRVAERVKGLLQQASTGNPPTRQAALKGLGAIVANAPTNTQYRLAYAFALVGNSEYSKALENAMLLSQTSIESHAFHFNLGQIFWLSGDDVRGRFHLELSLRYAHTDEERKDVRDRIAYLEAER